MEVKFVSGPGRVIVPGGADAEIAWKELVGVSSETQGEFVLHLLAKDRGWLAAFFDALSHTSQAQQAHFTDVHLLNRLYVAFRPSDNSVGAAKGVFRPAPALLLLLTRLQWDPDGEVHVPGNIQTWKEILRQGPDSKRTAKWAKSQNNDPQRLLESLFSLARGSEDAGPLQAFLSLSELGRQSRFRHRLETRDGSSRLLPHFPSSVISILFFPSFRAGRRFHYPICKNDRIG